MPSAKKKTGFNLIIVHIYIRGKLFIIRCDKKKTIYALPAAPLLRTVPLLDFVDFHPSSDLSSLK